MEETSTQTETAAVEETQETPTETQEPSFSYAEGIAGEGEKPEWFKDSKYKTIADQAKAYGDLESRFGGFTGKPEDGYSLSEGIEAVESPMLDSLKEIGEKYNMSNDMFNEIIETQIKAEQEAEEAFRSREIENLGENGQQRIDNANDWLSANTPEWLRDSIGNSMQSAEDIGKLEAWINDMKGQPLAPSDKVASSEPTHTQEGYEAMLMAKDERGMPKTRDAAYLKQTREYAAELAKLEKRK